jgi:ethanolamine-phosphate cytidylyltransferase
MRRWPKWFPQVCELNSEVPAGAPCIITADLVRSFNISVVVRGTISETTSFLDLDQARYEWPQSQDIFRSDPCSPRSYTPRVCLHEPITWTFARIPRQAAAVTLGSLTWNMTCRELSSTCDMTTKTIIERIIVNSKAYEDRQAKKLQSERAYYEQNKKYVDER